MRIPDRLLVLKFDFKMLGITVSMATKKMEVI